MTSHSTGYVAADELAGNDPLQYLIGALEDLEDLGVAVELLEPVGFAGLGHLAGVSSGG